MNSGNFEVLKKDPTDKFGKLFRTQLTNSNNITTAETVLPN